MKQTSLPFVFALWLFRNGVPDTPAAAAELRDIKERGVASIKEIVKARGRGMTLLLSTTLPASPTSATRSGAPMKRRAS